MAQVLIAFGKVSRHGNFMGYPTISEELDNSTSATSAGAAGTGDYCRVTAAGDNWLVFGTSPTATIAGAGCQMMKAGTEIFGPIAKGDKIACLVDS